MNSPNTSAAYQSYRQTEIDTAEPIQLILLLYDGAIKKLDMAMVGLAEKDMSTTHVHLVKVQDIVLELMLSLNWDADKKLCDQLHSLYDYMYRKLIDANVKKQKQPIQEVRELLVELRSGWQAVVKQAPTVSPSSPEKPRLNLQG